MTGESEDLRPLGPQPGDRPPAPGRLAVVQAFVNTHFDLVHDHGAEVLHSPAALRDWLAQAGLAAGGPSPGEHDLVRALTLREALRDLAGAGAADRGSRAALAGTADRVSRAALQRLDASAAGNRVEIRFGSNGPRFLAAPGTGVDGALGCLLAITALSIADGSWSRLKVCPGDHCGWAFYDHSRNRTGRWCSMSVCGGRVKAKRHYRRRTREI
jgi:predicted RNA-binding Zn ribbon-like protein